MYKVLRREDGKLVSCVIGKPGLEHLKKWQLTYYPNRWKRAKLGKIIICKTLKNAIGVFRAECAHEIWECETENVVRIKVLISLGQIQFWFKDFWRCKVRLSSFPSFFPAFPTYGADRIKLTKKVWPE